MDFKVAGQFVERPFGFDRFQGDFCFEGAAMLFALLFHLLFVMVLLFLLTHHLNYLSSFPGALYALG